MNGHESQALGRGTPQPRIPESGRGPGTDYRERASAGLRSQPTREVSSVCTQTIGCVGSREGPMHQALASHVYQERL
jgi:hypothetical protein